jgi:hypothetical protein
MGLEQDSKDERCIVIDDHLDCWATEYESSKASRDPKYRQLNGRNRVRPGTQASRKGEPEDFLLYDITLPRSSPRNILLRLGLSDPLGLNRKVIVELLASFVFTPRHTNSLKSRLISRSGPQDAVGR